MSTDKKEFKLKTPQEFVKEKYPNAKDMYMDEAGHAIMYADEAGKIITLSYGNSSSDAWKNAKVNILKIKYDEYRRRTIKKP